MQHERPDRNKQVKYAEMGDSLLLKAIGNTPKLRLIDIFLTNPYFDFTKQELSRELRMSKLTLYKNFRDLEQLGVMVFSRKIGRARLYRIDKSHPIVRGLDRIVLETSRHVAEEQLKKNIPSITVEH